MAEYITREEAIKMIDDYAKTISKDCIVVYQSIRDIVDEICPAADVVGVKHGEWIECFNELNKYCSVCEKLIGTIYHKPNFCENCGAKMDGKENAE